MIAAIYTRVSTDEQAEHGFSLPVQERQCREAADRDGATEVRLYRDDGYTGTNTDRPALQRLVREIHELDALYVWNLDRLFRDEVDQALFLRDVLAHGLLLRSVTNRHLDLADPDGWFYARLEGLFGHREIQKLRARVQAAQQERLRQGGYLGTIPLGYDIERLPDGTPIRGSPLQVLPEQAEVVRRIFDSYDPAGANETLSIIAEDLNAEGLRGRRGGIWTSSQVGRTLRNAMYVGELHVSGETYAAAHDPLVEREQWERVRARLDRRAGTHARSLDRISLSPLLRCGLCGGHVCRHGRSKDDAWRYRCGLRLHWPSDDRHPPVSVTAPKLEAAIWAWVRGVFRSGDLRRAAQRYRHRLEETDGRADLRAQLAEVEAQIRENITLYDQRIIFRDLVESRNRPLMQERDRLQSELREWREPIPAEVEELEHLGQAALENIEKTSDADAQVAFLGRLIEVVLLYPDNAVELRPTLGLPLSVATLPAYYAPQRGSTIEPELWSWRA